MNLDTLLTSISATTGIISMLIAIFAKLDSKNANNIAQRSHKRAAESITLAQQSNSIAIDARELAKEASTISRRAEKRDTELNYVSWNYHWKNTTTCNIINTGQDKALNTHITVTVNGESMSHPRTDIKPGHGINITLPKLLNQVRNHAEEFRTEQRNFETRRQAHNTKSTTLNTPFLEVNPIYIPLTFDVTVTIQWHTPLGTQHERVFQDPSHTFSLID
ncbi:hypothetical protein MHX62_00975 [Corynebacterium sp. ACRQM]|uniref:hypothetical protein n=2 Tax=Corynebacterium TaxID=1716 RepID=UPI001EF5388C|nr:hypothetical protein [Corynebacterium sp. ACRPR]MCG7232772.1 hypothetical protein [Corynebacterium sp. ACRPR]MCG7270653.1 hypothetical protein [Corynebacterium sp. ACRQM]